MTRAAAIAVPFSTYFMALILTIETLLRPCHAPKQAWRSANVRRIAWSPSSRLPHSKVADYKRVSSPLRLDADQPPGANARWSVLPASPSRPPSFESNSTVRPLYGNDRSRRRAAAAAR
jgi:hypothetical protein